MPVRSSGSPSAVVISSMEQWFQSLDISMNASMEGGRNAAVNDGVNSRENSCGANGGVNGGFPCRGNGCGVNGGVDTEVNDGVKRNGGVNGGANGVKATGRGVGMMRHGGVKGWIEQQDAESASWAV